MKHYNQSIKHKNFTSILSVFLLLFVSFTSSASLVDFETLPGGGMPTDDQALPFNASGEYTLPGGTTVRYGWDTTGDNVIDTSAHFEWRNGDLEVGNTAYVSDTNNRDQDLDPNHDGGQWMLRKENSLDDVNGGTNNGFNILFPQHNFLAVYGGILPTTAIGDIWDLDFSNELFEIDALAVSTLAVIATIVAPVGTIATQDGKAFHFDFAGLTGGAPIQMLRIRNMGTGGGIGFDGHSVPAPATLWLLGIGIIVMRCFVNKSGYAKLIT